MPLLDELSTKEAEEAAKDGTVCDISRWER
jgi:hypothetical protein